jgi:hypothetical protein
VSIDVSIDETGPAALARRPRAEPAALAWELVLVDRATLARAQQALGVDGTSAAIDRALSLAAGVQEIQGPVRLTPAARAPSACRASA